MIHFTYSNIDQITAGLILHGCDAEGNADNSVSNNIRTKWPQAFDSYQLLCAQANNDVKKHLLLGQVDYAQITEHLVIANGIIHTQGRTTINAVISCVEKALLLAQSMHLSFYMTKLGCAGYGLDWYDIEPQINSISTYLGKDINILNY